jgi:outer membrane protease
LGRWFDCNQTTGLEISYLTAETDTSGFFATSAGTTIIARPFYNVDTGKQDARLISYSEVNDGSIDVSARSHLDGLDFTMRHGLFWDSSRRLDFMAGYRYMQLKDVFRTHEATFSTDPSGLVPIGTATSIHDLFDTKNEFNGANLGFAGRMQNNRWSVDLLMKLGIGNTRSRVNLQGSSTITTPDGKVASYDSGLLVLDSNTQSITHNHFSMIPEIGINLGYDLTPRMRATVGYSLIYWSHVARAGDQVNTDLNPNEFQSTTWTGAAIPRETFVVDDYWIQGLNVGLDLHF